MNPTFHFHRNFSLWDFFKDSWVSIRLKSAILICCEIGFRQVLSQMSPESGTWNTNTQIHKYTITLLHNYTSTQVHKYTNTQIRKYTNMHIHKPGWRCEWGHYCEHKVTPFAGLAATFCLSSIFTFASLCSEDDSLAARASSCFHWLSNLKTWNLLKGTRFEWLRYRSISSGFPIKANNLGQPLVCMLTSR